MWKGYPCHDVLMHHCGLQPLLLKLPRCSHYGPQNRFCCMPNDCVKYCWGPCTTEAVYNLVLLKEKWRELKILVAQHTVFQTGLYVSVDATA